VNSERHDFGENMSMRGPRNPPNLATEYPRQVGFLSKEELLLPRATVRIVGIVVLAPLLVLIVWALLHAIFSSGQSEKPPASVYGLPAAIAYVDQCWSQPKGEVGT